MESFLTRKPVEKAVVSAGAFRLEVLAAPRGELRNLFRLFRGRDLLLASARADGREISLPGAFQRRAGEPWRAPTGYLLESAGEREIRVRAPTEVSGIELKGSFTLNEDRLRVRWETADGTPLSGIGDVLAIQPSGRWFGFGNHETASFPWEEFRADPFLVNNIQNPFWVTSKGLGIRIPGTDPLRLFFNVQGDGTFGFGTGHFGVGKPFFEYEVLLADTPAEVLARFTAEAGRPRAMPAEDLFRRPMYCTWTQHPRHVTQGKALAYARKAAELEFPRSAFILDEIWCTAFGDFEFDPRRFPDPKGLVDELHGLGFKALLWICPFVHPDAKNFTVLRDRGWLVKDARTGEPGAFGWWENLEKTAALLDFTNPEAAAWYAAEMERMKREFGFDGFKFDGGDGKYQPDPASARFHAEGTTPNGFSDAMLRAVAAAAGPWFESRVAFGVQDLGIVAREGGKDSRWDRFNGLHALLIQGLNQGLVGYPYLCADMIPGRTLTRYKDAPLPTDEFYVRWVEASVLTPIVQFSYAPWNYSDPAVTEACRLYARLHEGLGGLFVALAREAMATGMPIVRPLFLDHPEDPRSFERDDEFLVGRDLLVAPILEEGAVSRDVLLPKGTWIEACTEEAYPGGRLIENHPAPCPGLPLFVREEAAATLLPLLTPHLKALDALSVSSGVCTATYREAITRGQFLA